jgi:hypothetical protein
MSARRRARVPSWVPWAAAGGLVLAAIGVHTLVNLTLGVLLAVAAVCGVRVLMTRARGAVTGKAPAAKCPRCVASEDQLAAAIGERDHADAQLAEARRAHAALSVQLADGQRMHADTAGRLALAIAELGEARAQLADAKESAALAWDAAAERTPRQVMSHASCECPLVTAHEGDCPLGPGDPAMRAALTTDPMSGVRPLGGGG